MTAIARTIHLVFVTRAPIGPEPPSLPMVLPATAAAFVAMLLSWVAA
jgi:hypothetical protein